MALSLGLLLACGNRDAGPSAGAPQGADSVAPSGDVGDAAGDRGDAVASAVAALAPLLARAADPGLLPDAERQSLEQAMRQVLLPAITCQGCTATVAYVDEAAGGDHFRCDVDDAAGAPVAELAVFHRPSLPADAAKDWGRSTLEGHPASELSGEMLFVWPGRFEIRAFARGESLRAGRVGGEKRLADLLGSLPLDRLARL